jgi:hypothetical protein
MLSKKVFISHSTKDREFVRKLVADLICFGGVKIWYSEWELRVGDSLRQKIEDGISQSNLLVIVLSPNSVKSSWVNQELSAAFVRELARQEVFILPVLIGDCEIPVFLQDKVYADFRQDYVGGLKDLLRGVNPLAAGIESSQILFERTVTFEVVISRRKEIITLDSSDARSALRQLAEAPRKTAELLLQSYSQKEIAQVLGYSPTTIRRHIKKFRREYTAVWISGNR